MNKAEIKKKLEKAMNDMNSTTHMGLKNYAEKDFFKYFDQYLKAFLDDYILELTVAAEKKDPNAP